MALATDARSTHRDAALLAGGYAVFGTAWILFSDYLLLAMAHNDTQVLAAVGVWKGLAFVFSTSGLLYGLRYSFGRRAAAAPSPRRAGPALSLWALATVAAVILLLGLVASLRSLRDQLAQEQNELREVAEVKRDMAQAWLSERCANAKALAGSPDLSALYAQYQANPDAPARARLAAQLRMVLLATEYSHAWLVGPSGAVLAQAGPAPSDMSPRETRLAVQALADGRPADTSLYTDAAVPDDIVRFAQAAPVLAPGMPSAVAVLRAGPHRTLVPQLLARPGAEPGEHVRLVRRSLAAPPRDGQEQVEGPRMLSVEVPIAGSDWSVRAEAFVGPMEAHVWHDAAWFSVIVVLALLATSATIYALWQRRESQHALHSRQEQDERLRLLNLLEAVTGSSSDVIFAKDREGRYLFANEEACRRLARRPADVLGRTGAAFFTPDQAARAAASDLAVMRSHSSLTEEVELSTPEHSSCFLMTKSPLRDASGEVVGVVGIGRDITERRRNEQTQRLWASAFESTRDGVVITDSRSRIVAVNRAFSEITGYEPQEAIGRPVSLLKSDRHDEGFYRALRKELADTGCWKGEIWHRRRNGEVYPEWLTVSAVPDPAGRMVNYVGVFTDITQVKESEAQLERLAHYDPLTALPNRRLLETHLAHALAHAQRHGTRVAVLYLDLDGFKTVNDSLGHPAGDELLRTTAQRLQARLRGEDLLGRLGGDEYLVVLDPLASPNEAASVARDLLLAVAQPVQLSVGTEVYVTASIGISVHPDDGSTSVTEMLRDADAAMYQAKADGRNCFRFFTRDLHAEAVARLELEAALSRAVERDELLLHYQPKVAAADGRLAGMEALLRWQRGGSEMVPPCRFIPVAERSSVILRIGAWVIDQACRQLRNWLDDGLKPVPVAVNVAARQFEAGDLDRVLAAALRQHGVPPEYLEVELTESMLVAQPRAAEEQLRRIKALGVKVSLDDFGTGYSSLGYLQRFTIDTLKIDQSFVHEIGQGSDGAAIVDAIVALAHRLNLRVVAEGVETAAQRDHLVAQGCDELQGFFFSRPLPEHALRPQLLALGRAAVSV